MAYKLSARSHEVCGVISDGSIARTPYTCLGGEPRFNGDHLQTPLLTKSYQSFYDPNFHRKGK